MTTTNTSTSSAQVSGRNKLLGLIFIFVCIFTTLLSACTNSSNDSTDLGATQIPAVTVAATASVPTATPLPTATQEIQPTAIPTAIATASPIPAVLLPDPLVECGQILPLLPANDVPVIESLDPDSVALANLKAIVPEEGQEALDYILAHPESVGLAVYQVGQEANGAFLNAEVPMPLASVVKVIDLIAYAEAVAAGEFDPLSTVTLDEIEAYYLPTTDLGSHTNAVESLEANGRLFGEPATLLLDEVPGMMIQFSDNAATDYLHMLLGQERIEETAVALDLASQTAPCPFVGQFLAMGNHTRTTNNDDSAVQAYIDDPASYGREVMALTEAFAGDSDFRETAVAWRQDTRRPASQTQRFFSHTLNAHGSAADYAGLMAQIALNGLSDPDASFITRRYMEWPMRFPDNQAEFTNLGYKGGSLPGILTTAYYAYPQAEATPVVLALFFRDLDGRSVYREWRNSQTHDELARWLLADPAAIPALRAVLISSEQ